MCKTNKSYYSADVSAGFNIAISTQRGGLWVVGGHQGGDGSWHLAPYGHWVGFVCMGVPPASKMGCLGLLAWGTPSYTQNQPNGHMELDASSHHPPGAPLPPTSRPVEWLWRYKNRHFCVYLLVLHKILGLGFYIAKPAVRTPANAPGRHPPGSLGSTAPSSTLFQLLWRSQAEVEY